MNAFRPGLTEKGLDRISYIKLSVAFIVTSTAALIVYLVHFHTPPTLGEVLNEFGYQEIVPPSQLYGPGTFNSVEQLSDQSVKLHPTCNMDTEILKELWDVSPTVNREMVSRFSRGFDVSTEHWESLKSKVSNKKI